MITGDNVRTTHMVVGDDNCVYVSDGKGIISRIHTTPTREGFIELAMSDVPLGNGPHPKLSLSSDEARRLVRALQESIFVIEEQDLVLNHQRALDKLAEDTGFTRLDPSFSSAS